MNIKHIALGILGLAIHGAFATKYDPVTLSLLLGHKDNRGDAESRKSAALLIKSLEATNHPDANKVRSNLTKLMGQDVINAALQEVGEIGAAAPVMPQYANISTPAQAANAAAKLFSEKDAPGRTLLFKINNATGEAVASQIATQIQNLPATGTGSGTGGIGRRPSK